MSAADADFTADRQAARHVLVQAEARAEAELVDELRLELVRTIGRQRTESRRAAVLEHHRRVVEQAADVRAGAAVFVRLRQARVVAIQAAPRVARRGGTSCSTKRLSNANSTAS